MASTRKPPKRVSSPVEVDSILPWDGFVAFRPTGSLPARLPDAARRPARLAVDGLIFEAPDAHGRSPRVSRHVRYIW